MRKKLFILAALCVAVMLLCASAAAAEGEFPQLNADGFLDEDEFVYENATDGIWRYCGPSLRVEIYRRSQAKPKLVWYEAEIWSSEDSVFRMTAHDEEKRMKVLEYPYKIAREHRVVFAVNGDFAHMRISKKMRVGILLRDGKILSERTYAQNKGTFPNLDTLALMPDGTMHVFGSDELKAKEYVEMGALDVLAFGPYMVRDGELNTRALKKYGTSRAPRTGIGMVEKGHYFAVMVEGRSKTSLGASVQWLGEKLFELGCGTAFNLDGGQSSGIIFLGRQICTVLNDSGRRASARKAAEILGIGYSESVATLSDPF